MRRSKAKVKSSWNGSFALIRVDNARLRRQTQAAYQRAQRDLAEAQRELDQFQRLDQPRFKQWVQRHFGALLAELHETSSRLEEQREMLLELHREILLRGASPQQAYARVRRRRQAQEPPPEQSEFQFNGAGKNGEPDDDDDPPPWDRPRPEPKPQARPKTLARLKELYRALVRRLHPDTGRAGTPHATERWHQVQVAYQQGDVQQLELILTLCEVEGPGKLENANLSILQRLTRHLRQTLRGLRVELAECREDPAWHFTQRRDINALAGQIRRQLEHDLLLYREDLRMVTLQLAAWAAEPSRPARRRRGALDPFPFF